MAHSYSPFTMTPQPSGSAVGTASSYPPDRTSLPSTMHQTASKNELTSHETHPIISPTSLTAPLTQDRVVKDSFEAKGLAIALFGPRETPTQPYYSMDISSICPPKTSPHTHDNTATLSRSENSPRVSIDFWRHDVKELVSKDLQTFDNKAKAEVQFINEDNVVYEALSTNAIINPSFNRPLIVTTPLPSTMGADITSSPLTEVARPAYMNEYQMKTMSPCPPNAMNIIHPTGKVMFDESQKHSPIKAIQGANAFTLRSTACDDETVSPKEAFLDFEHVFTKLEGEAVRRARHSKLNNIIAELQDRQPSSGHSGPSLSHSEKCWISSAASNSNLPCPYMLWAPDSMKTEAAFPCNFKSNLQRAKRYRDNTSTCSLPPPQCVPKNAMRWTSSNASKASVAPQTCPQSSTPKYLAVQRECEDNQCARSSQKLNLEVNRKTEHPTYDESKTFASADNQSQGNSDHPFFSFGDAVEEGENFSASSGDEISPLEVDMAILEGIVENAQKPFRSSSTSINNPCHNSETTFNSAGSLSIESMQEEILVQPPKHLATPPSGPQSSTNSSQKDPTLSPIASNDIRPIDTFPWLPSSSNCSVNDVHPSSHASLVNRSDRQKLDSESEIENVARRTRRKTEKEKKRHVETSPAFFSVSKLCKNPDSMDVSKAAMPLLLGENPVHEGKKFVEVNTDSTQKVNEASEQLEELRTTSSSQITLLSNQSGLDSRLENDGSHSSDNEITEYLDTGDQPLTAPRRTTRRTSLKTAGQHSGLFQLATKTDTPYPGGLRKLNPRYTSNRRGSQIRTSNPSEASSSNTPPTGPIQCGYVDKKTGERCETVFKRPYDLARHKETIHDTEGPEGDRKPQWTCDQCGGGFSRKDALMRHCRIRDHKAAVSKS